MLPKQRFGRALAFTAAAALTIAATVHVANAFQRDRGDDNSAASYAIGLWGDVPYSAAQVNGVKNLIADMNSQRLAFTVNDGDLKAGSGACTEEVYAQAIDFLRSLKAPAAFTPGDNDWTDCDRTAGYNSLAQLDRERTLFFSTPYTMGQRALLQEVQETPLCLGFGNRSVRCVENRRWTVGRVVYVTLNVQGSCNNRCDTAPDDVEWSQRNTANIAWLKQSFAAAKANRAVAVMLISQANPGFDGSDATRAPLRDPKTLKETTDPDGFQNFLAAVREETIAFKKPVAYVHGDSHYFRVDKPLLTATGARVENFTRVETFGDNAANGLNDVHWVKVLVDPRSREVFAYQPQVVPENRTAVPAL